MKKKKKKNKSINSLAFSLLLNDDVVIVLHSLCQQIWKTQQWPQDCKSSIIFPIPKKSNARESSNYHTITLVSYASKIMLKIFQSRLQEYVNWGLPDVQAGFRKGRGTRDQIANICWVIENSRELKKKKIYFCFIDYEKPLNVWSRLVVSNSLRPVDCSPPSSSVHGILQARILEWVAIWMCGSQKNCGIFLVSWENHTILPASWETCMQDKRQ